ncbi:hypothetical protein P3T76_002639 [Phytophthora citrophthora]|uniref:RxLR effector protein n=1 Tax=Phytophthora citrophthora TaxID=4793 RepID=A0AAD9LR89_9STRA|nr:hypothetical protein P3T76_002639 [Phytophthora citrophthora]
MRSSFSLILLLVAFVSFNIIVHADSIPNGVTIRDNSNAPRQLSSSNANVDAEEEERIRFSGLKKLKNLIRGNNKSAVTVGKSSAIMKEAEGMKNSPVLAKGFKSVSENRVMMKRINSLEKLDPKAVETLRKAPVEKSVNRVSSYLSRGQSFHISEGDRWVIFLISMRLFSEGLMVCLHLLISCLDEASS